MFFHHSKYVFFISLKITINEKKRTGIANIHLKIAKTALNCK